jgi:hypothetical protein
LTLLETDLTGGLDPAFEYFRRERPEDPGMRDSATLWVLDKSGRFALPRVTFDAVGETWDMPDLQLNFVADDGQVMRIWAKEPGGLVLDDHGNAAIRTAGPARFSCIEPFRRWSLEFDGTALRRSIEADLAGETEAVETPLSFSVVAEMAAPPWLMGGMTPEAARAMMDGDANQLMGGVRYEQLCRVTGSLTYDGQTYPVDANGMRVRRQGVRNMGAALGHCQHSALWPSGRAFGAIIMAPGPEGPVAFNEAFLILTNGRKIAARIVSAPWMTRLVAGGDDASLVLESEVGEVRIAGEVLLSLFDHHNFEMADTSILQQGTVRYRWDGEETIGLIERCTLRNKLAGA